VDIHDFYLHATPRIVCLFILGNRQASKQASKRASRKEGMNMFMLRMLKACERNGSKVEQQ